MKSTVVDESLSSFKTNVLFQRIPSFCKIGLSKFSLLRFHPNNYFVVIGFNIASMGIKVLVGKLSYSISIGVQPCVQLSLYIGLHF